MARIRVVGGMPALALVVAAVAVACAEARVPDDYRTFTVTGKVQCQDCTKNWNAYAYNARPIPGSMVSITCRDDKSRVVHHDSDYTDSQGVFNIDVPTNKADNGYSYKIAPSQCLVRLASSGDAGCAVFTDFNHGKTGQTPSRVTYASPDKKTFSVGPFYCTLQQCDVKDDDACY